MDTQRIPIIGNLYKYFDDGKIKHSRMYDVEIIDICKYEDADKELIKLWIEEVKYCDWIYKDTTDLFINGVICMCDGDEKEVTFVRTIDDDWFSLGFWAGRLDLDGKLFEYLESV